MPLQIPVTQTGLEASIEAAAKKVGRNLQINLGTNAKSINSLSQPLGRITGQADEFTKSMEAANARVFAFGASVGIIHSVSSAFGTLIKNTIEVEKSLVEINSVLNESGDSLQKFGNKLFDVAKSTGQTFDVVAKGALELARQGLSTEETLKRINDALILSRLSGLDAQQSVEGLTAAFNSFKETGITTSQILNKLVVVSQKYSVSERDLIEGLKRSASVADQAGVSFDELVGIITTVQERTARGGAVIGNAFKTIFARIQDTGALQDLSNLGIQVTDLEGKILPATKILQNLGAEFNNLSQLEQADIAKKLGGVYQLSNLLAAVKDLSSEQSKYNDIVKLSAGATNEAYQKNAALNETLASLINKVSVSAQQLGATLGAIGITDNLKSLLAFFNNILEGIQKILGEESALGTFVQGLAKGIGNVLAGPGLILFGAIIAKLSKDLISFGFESLKSFFKIGQATKEINALQGSIASTLLRNKDIQAQILTLEGNRVAQAKFFTTALNEQYLTMQKMQGIAASIAPAVYGGTRGGRSSTSKNAAGGYMPAVSQESRDISRGVGGARSGDKPVVIPNFAFGGGKKGTMVAHTGEFIVPNFAAGGSAIFNRDMVRSMGLPAGAQKINAAGGFIPNFASKITYGGKTYDTATNETFKKYAADYEGKQEGLNAGIGFQSLAKYNIGNPNPDKGFYVFPDGSAQYGSRIMQGLTRPTSQATVKKQKAQAKEEQFGSFTLDANQLGGILVVSPRFGAEGIGSLNAKLQAHEIPFFNYSSAPPIDKNKFIKLNNLKTSNTPKPQNVKGLQGDISQLFAGGIVDLAYRLYGGTFDPASAGEFSQKLKSLDPSKKEQLIPAAAQGSLFEAAGKVALNTFSNLESLFGSAEENRPFDFQNAAAMQKMFGVSVGRGEAKRGDEKNFETSKQITGIVKKVFNDPEYSLKALDALKKQGAFSPEMQRKKSTEEVSNAINGFIPNFVSQKYIMDTLARIKAGTSGFSKQEQETFLSKFGAKSTGRKISLREVYDKLDGDIGISALIDKAYMAAGPTASNEDVYRIFERQVKANPYQLRSLVSKKGFVPNFADPLEEAINREMSAGIPASQIYVDQNSSLKNSMNPMGLMVANRRDEPGGGIQGINRARREGANPMMYGAAGGFVPNYAAKIPDIAGQVKQGLGGATFTKPVEDAINAFGKKAIAAGSNMDKLSKQLEATLTSLTQNSTASKIVADEAKKQAQAIKLAREVAAQEAQAKREALSNQILNNQSNKKLAAKLDKIYLEYNKSEKTAQDLQNAQIKAAAILNKTSLSQGTQAAIVGSTASLAGNRQPAQVGAAGSRDMLGTIFAVQAGLSLLTGATADATSAFGKYTNIVSGGIGTATSTLFAFQGLSSALPKFAGFLGPAGIAVSAATAAFQIGKGIFLELSGANKRAADAGKTLAAAAEKAALRLDELGGSGKQDIERTVDDIIKKLNININEAELPELKKAISAGLLGTSRTDVENILKTNLEKQNNLVQTGTTTYGTATYATESSLGGKITNAVNKLADLSATGQGAVLTKDFLPLATKAQSPEELRTLINTELGKNLKDFKLNDGLIKEIFDPEALLKAKDQLKQLSLSEDPNKLNLLTKEGKSPYDWMGLPTSKLIPEEASQLTKFLEEIDISYATALDLINKIDEAREQQSKLKAEGEAGAGLESAREFNRIIKSLSIESSIRKKLYDSQNKSSQAEYENNLRISQINSDITLSETERSKLLKDQEVAYAKRISNLENEKTLYNEIRKIAESVGKKTTDPNRQIESQKKVLEFLENFKNTKEFQDIVIGVSIGKIDDTAVKNQIKKLSEGFNLDPAQLNDLYAGVLNLATQQGTLVDQAKQENYWKQKNAELDKDSLDIAKNKSAFLERINYKLESQSSALDFRAGAISSQQSVNQARKELETAIYERTSLATTAEDFKKGLDEINQKYFDLEMAAEREKAALEIKSELTRNLKVDENSLKLVETTTALNNLKGTVEESIQKLPSILAQAREAGQGIQSPYRLDDLSPISAKASNAISGGLFNDVNDQANNCAKVINRFADSIGLSIKGANDIANSFQNVGEAIDMSNLKPGDILLNTRGKGPGVAGGHVGMYLGGGQVLQASQKAFDQDPITKQQRAAITGFNTGDWNMARRLMPKGQEVTQFAQQGVTQQLGLSEKAYSEAVKIAALDISKIGEAAEKAAKEFLGADAPAEEISKFATSIRQAAEGFKKLGIDEAAKRKVKETEDKIAALAIQPRTFAEGWAEAGRVINKDIADYQYKLGEAIPTSFANNLTQGIQDAITGAKSLEDALVSAALSFVQEIQSMAIKNLAQTFTSSLFGFSKGGEVKGYASGGMINGGSGSKDDVPAMLMGGEYVINKKSVQKYGPEFLHAINNGQLGGYAKGGEVKDLPVQSGVGGFYVPGTYGQGGIQGRQNLLGFATQAATSGQYDIITGGDNYAGINLEGESARLTTFGRTRGPQADLIRSAKEEAFGLYQQDVEAEKQRKEQQKQLDEQSKAMKIQLLMSIGSVVAGSALSAGASGFKAAFGAAQAGGATGLSAFGSGLKGIFTGASASGGISAGGLNNWFTGIGKGLTGNFDQAGNYLKLSQMGSLDQLGKAYSMGVGLDGKNSSFTNFLDKSGYIPRAFSANPEKSNGIMNMFGLFGNKRATGGMIPPTSGIDTVPALLSGGEFIMNRAASQNIGTGNLQALNAGASSLPTEEKTEELNDRLVAKLDELITVMTESSTSGSVTINVDSNGKATQETSGETSESREKLARQIKDTVMKVIEQEKRLGGKLRRGL